MVPGRGVRTHQLKGQILVETQQMVTETTYDVMAEHDLSNAYL